MNLFACNNKDNGWFSLTAEQRVEARPRRWLVPVALVLLQDENSYGYELMERIEEEFGFEQINPRSEYRSLRQMENEGLCNSQWDVRNEERGPPPRRMCAVTDESAERPEDDLPAGPAGRGG